MLDTSAARADALATALAVMGPEAGPEFAADNRIAALFLIADGAGLREVTTETAATHLIG